MGPSIMADPQRGYKWKRQLKNQPSFVALKGRILDLESRVSHLELVLTQKLNLDADVKLASFIARMNVDSDDA